MSEVGKVVRVGVLGAGQLALMLAEAARELGIEVVCAGAAGDCAARVAPLVEVDLADAEAVRAFAAGCDLVTIESENIDAAVLVGLRMEPNVRAVSIAQDRLLEKRFFHEQGIGTAPFRAVDSLEDLRRALEELGTPAILKTRRLGYDGRGQVRLAGPGQSEAAWEEVGGVPCVLEGLVRFVAEVSLIAARGCNGETAFYPLTENHHREGILRTSIAPAHPELQLQAQGYLQGILQTLDYVGVLAVEFFVCEDGALVANEMAPRVHNSGHWTIEGARTSQFANHLRALAGLSLGSTASQPTVMLNCIGTMPRVEETERWPAISRHDYGKQARPGRKVGHLTCGADETAIVAFWREALKCEA